MELFNTPKMISLDEVTLIPASKSYIESRSHCNPYIEGTDKLPIFIAPMTCLINRENYSYIRESKFIPILPVSYKYNNGSEVFTKDFYEWQAISINSLKNINIDTLTKDSSNILIDCANGNMNIIFETVKKIKAKLNDDISIMIGNIANPATYEQCILSGVDYVRVGIGGGGGCLTSVNTGIHCSLPWIIKGCLEVRERYKNRKYTKIVADGGINSIDKIIKCLALGADYVMIGEMFAKCHEACSIIYQGIGYEYREYYGQASKQGQIDRFGIIKSYPEGTVKEVVVESSIDDLIPAIEASLRSAMSYCNCSSLSEFINNKYVRIQSIDEYRAYYKH